jgi:hypothetical protein
MHSRQETIMNPATSTFIDTIKTAFPPEPITAAGAFDQRGVTYPDAADYMRQMDGKTWEELDVTGLLSPNQRHLVAAALAQFTTDFPAYASQARIALERYWSSVKSQR